MFHLIPSTDYWLHLDEHRRRVDESLADAQQAQLAATIRDSGSRRARSQPSRGRPLLVRASVTVHAPMALVEAVYTDYRSWAATFPTIADVRLIGRRGSTKVLDVDHVEGKVINELTVNGDGKVELWEGKRRYDAVFTIRAEPSVDGTHLVVNGELKFKGAVRLIQPFLGHVRRQLLKLQLEPVKRRAEQACIADRTDPTHPRCSARSPATPNSADVSTANP